MRKDVRLGLGVGGILFGVVLVYVLFFAGGKGEDQFAGDLGSESTQAVTSGGGGDGVGSDPAAGSVQPYGTGTTLVNTDPIAGTAPPPTPFDANNGSRNRSGNGSGYGPGNTNAIGGAGPATRPADALAGGGFNSPTASGWAWNWRDLVNYGARDGQLLSLTETPSPTPGGGRPLGEQHRIALDPPGTPHLEARSSEGSTTAGARVYVVKPGDSFWSIARTEYGNSSYYNHLVRANPKVDPAKLKAGMRITVPGREEVVPTNAPPAALTPTPVVIDEMRQYRVKRGDNLSTIARNLYGREAMAEKIYQLNRDVIGPNPSALKLNAILMLPETPTRLAGGTAN